MNAPITEAHRELAPLIAYACYGGKFDDDQTDEQQIPERCLVVAAQLIADSEAKAVAECGHDLIVREYRQRGELLRDEANRRKEAEAELDDTKERALTLANSLDQAQAELATERARLDWLNLRAPKCWSLIDAQMLAGKTETICAAIDAAIKEDAK